ncbi:MAG: phosphate acyltransferase, partial [Planctomycetota bacterium]
MLENPGTRAKMADFFQETLEKANTNLKKIVLSEGEDQRILQAAKTIAEQSIAKLVILGDPDQTRSSLEKLSVDTEAFEYLDPETSEKVEQYADLFYELRKHKGITASQAEGIIKDHIYFAT